MTEVYLIETGGGEALGRRGPSIGGTPQLRRRGATRDGSAGIDWGRNAPKPPRHTEDEDVLPRDIRGLVLVARGGSILGNGRLDEAPSGGPRVGTTVNVTLTLTVVFWQLRR